MISTTLRWSTTTRCHQQQTCGLWVWLLMSFLHLLLPFMETQMLRYQVLSWGKWSLMSFLHLSHPFMEIPMLKYQVRLWGVCVFNCPGGEGLRGVNHHAYEISHFLKGFLITAYEIPVTYRDFQWVVYLSGPLNFAQKCTSLFLEQREPIFSTINAEFQENSDSKCFKNREQYF